MADATWTKLLRLLGPDNAVDVRSGALAAAGTPSAESAAVDSLLDTDPGVVEASTRSLIGEIPSLTSAHRKALADHLLELLKRTKADRPPLHSETAVVRLLSALGDG